MLARGLLCGVVMAEEERPANPPSSTFRFGHFELDNELFELRCRARPLPVQPKVLKLLFYLVQQQGRTVPNQELRQALWPGETVCAGSLKRAICAARRILDDSGSSQSWIRTVRGCGYRFVAPDPPARPDASNRACRIVRARWLPRTLLRRTSGRLKARRRGHRKLPWIAEPAQR
ncbi:MAG TPA: winged helix-turn-helix domain-containing protein [Polyangiaceae bacterium]|nr:winged helix-turn-helix domain-containing protein [Polyangiaceae bacterium]